ncbi:hypothetical protein [Helicobacter turcicus]|uniref:Pyridoxamine 5'-phosphate oxidase putative domain-containing protein n=1 Tax=Helicobacter turcicus TaxID=2867412 RepID=A0ABS7JLZ7_9HELI|nr:hypothetical protein [Helicobacter turcicus]MBX7490405.1 hypothetical protein [Helicobacter turcicus]MBX7545263.1 hypothetical protein [Helicobacter turcicus]
MDDRIKAFIAEQHLLSLSVIDSTDSAHLGIYTASCYYVFFSSNLSLCFKSDSSSKHIKLAYVNPSVGVTIAQDSNILANIKGAQIQARFRDSSQEEQNAYYKKFPFAKLGGGVVFALDICFAKYTNNQLLLQEKLTYTKE